MIEVADTLETIGTHPPDEGRALKPMKGVCVIYHLTPPDLTHKEKEWEGFNLVVNMATHFHSPVGNCISFPLM